MSRAFIIVMDGFGVGNAPDAAAFGDEGSNTLHHIAQQCATGHCDKQGVRRGLLHIPNLDQLGLGRAAELSSGRHPRGLDFDGTVHAAWGVAQEISNGKDSPSGHWEMAGLPVPFDWGYFPHEIPTFPQSLTDEIIEKAKIPGIIGNKHGSGTKIVAELGEEHLKTGKPICYTSVDSVFQIAAHEEEFGLERLYEVCKVVRELTYHMNLGRVIARPFLGSTPKTFKRTANRKDFAIVPPQDTLLDRLKVQGRQVISVGKISDLFAGKGITKSIKASGHPAIFEAMLQAEEFAESGDLVFVNFVDFDTLFGHQRDVTGYANALEEFDAMLPGFIEKLRPNDLAIITADHGNDPTWKGSDHTREQVPVLAFGPNIRRGRIGVRKTFADIGETVAKHLGIEAGKHGHSFL